MAILCWTVDCSCWTAACLRTSSGSGIRRSGATFKKGRTCGVAERYLCRNRNPWYVQERRPPAPFACTYIGRRNGRAGSPFRFILNHSQATAANVYLLMYPHPAAASALRDEPALVQEVWQALRNIPPDDLLAEGRMYGGGLHKIEPRELGNVAAPELAKLLTPGAAGSSHAALP